MTDEKPAEFIASFPDTQSAITMHGSGGMRITLEIPDTQMALYGNAIDLIKWRGKALDVLIVPREPGPATEKAKQEKPWK